MASKGMNLIIKLQGQVDKMLPGSLKKLASEAKELRAQKNQLDRAMRAGKAQQELKKEMRETNKIYVQTRREMKLLENAKRTGKTLTEEEKRKYQALNLKAKELEKTIKSQSRSYQKYGMELKKLKVPFDQLQSEIDQTKKKYKELMAQQKIAGGVNNFKQGIGRVKDRVKSAAKTALAIGTAATIGLGINSAQDYLQFDSQMSKVKALTQATAEEFSALKEKAMEVGKTTIFTSDEAAAGMEKFALAGFKPKEIIEALPGVFDLAAASGEDFVMISDMISDHMTAFNLSVTDVGKASDILANTMSRSNTNIQGLSEAFKYASAGAADLKIDLSTTSAAVGLMGDQAIKSGQAGRNLKQAFSHIADAGVQNKLKKLGVRVKDANGEFIGMVSFVRELEKVTSKMTGIDKSALLKDLFGDQGSLAMNKILTSVKEVNGVVYKGADALEQFARENENAAGKAKQMAGVLLDSDSGRWALLKSAISDVKLKIGSFLFQGGGTDFIKIATEYANELSNVLSGKFNDSKANQFWKEFIENGKKSLVGLKAISKILWNLFKFLNGIGIDNILIFLTVFSMTSKVIKFGGALANAFSTIKAAGGILSAVKTGIAVLGGPISLVIAALAVLGYIIYKNWDKVKMFFDWLWEKMKWFAWNVGIYFLGPIGVVIRHWDLIKEKAVFVFNKIKELMGAIGESIKNFFKKIFDYIPNLISKAKDKTVDFLKSIPGASFFFSEEGKGKKKLVDGSHANGLDYVPFNGYIAELHQGERVLTKNENESIFGSLRNRISVARNNSSVNTTTNNNNQPIVIKMENNFTGVTEETKNSIIEALKKQMEDLKLQIEEIRDREETHARLSL